MTAVFLSPIYLILCLYILRRILNWLGHCHKWLGKRRVSWTITGIFAFFVLSLALVFILPPSGFRRILKLISNYWLGVLLYGFMMIAGADLIRLILKRVSFPGKERLFSRKGHVAVGFLCMAATVGISAWGIWNAGTIRTTRYSVPIAKEAGELEDLKIVLVSDLHLGYSIGTWNMIQMVEKINEEKPDLVVVAGDIFDNDYEALDDPKRLAKVLSGIQSRYGVYACYGNHDIEERILAGFTFPRKEKKQSDPRMDEFLEQAGITLLHDEGVLIDQTFYLYGRADYEKPGRGIEVRKIPEEITKEMDLTKPVILLDHQPKELSKLAEAGVDLDLCGHTHGGQIFPGNIITSLMWENSYGCVKKENMYNIVTSGVGIFGPYMRLGSKSEICVIDVEFTG